MMIQLKTGAVWASGGDLNAVKEAWAEQEYKQLIYQWVELLQMHQQQELLIQ